MIDECNGEEVKQVRKIGPTRRSVSGFYSFRDQGSVAFESTLERDFLVRSAFSRCVLDVVAQPVSIPFKGVNGQTYHYTPDYFVKFRLGSRDYHDYPRPLLIEVKPEKEWKQHWREWSDKWKAAGRYARDKGWGFRILDERRIRDQMFVNVRFLDKYKRTAFPIHESAALLARIEALGCVTAGQLLTPECPHAGQLAHLWHLLAVRELDCDMRFPLNEDTELWVGHDD